LVTRLSRVDGRSVLKIAPREHPPLRPANKITLADILRAVEGPLANIHDTSLADLAYAGPAAKLLDVWMARNPY